MNQDSWKSLAELEINNKTKPVGALGHLESVAIQLASIQKTLKPAVFPAQVLVFGADHGVTRQGVSAYPAEVTGQMMANFSSGGAAINVISNSVGASIRVVDVGVASDLSRLENISHCKIMYGTNDISVSAAMSRQECDLAIGTGRTQVKLAHESGIKTIALGEMGIGNTTSAAALVCAITHQPAALIVGRGTGVNDDVYEHKCRIVEQAVKLHTAASTSSQDFLSSLGGLEIAAIAGAILEAAERGMVIIIDGFISTAGAVCACEINPGARKNLIFSHLSTEQGHKLALEHLDASPVLNLDLRLGEGTGAALSLPIINAAAQILCDMATFEQAGVSGKSN